jgi:hypothetical protein
MRPKWDCRMTMRAFLASSDGDRIIAQTLSVDGGNWMG